VSKTNPYIDFLLEQFEPLGDVTVRAMFGGHGLYCDSVFFALVSNNAVFLKADDANRGEFEARHLKPFRPYEGRDEVMSYYEAPAEMFEDADALKHWAGGSVAAGRRAQLKKKAKPKRTR